MYQSIMNKNRWHRWMDL